MIVCTETDMACLNWLLFTDKLEGISNMAQIYPKPYIECRDSVFDGRMDSENSKAALGINLGFECRD